METRKLYYENSHLYEFEATVLSCAGTEKGYLVALDATAFYPEGGGQACDLGILGDAQVLDVQEQGDTVVHLCNKPLPVGQTVHGVVDRQRRLDLMQQHSGEHIVSGIICSRFGYHNVGFHVGKAAMEIDFDGPIPPEALEEIELLANEAIWENLSIRCWYPSETELPTVFYRSKKQLPWPVRIVEIPGFDTCACCGVHVEHTGEIGLIKLLSCVKLRNGVRIEMVCGRRAFLLTQGVFAQNKAVSQAFSAKMLETGAAAQKMNEQLATEKLRANTLQSRILRSIAAGYAGQGDTVHFEDSLSGGQIRELAEEIAAQCGGRAAVLSGADGNYNLCMVQKEGDLKPLTKALQVRFGARGGGKPGYFQGTISGEKEEILRFFKACSL